MVRLAALQRSLELKCKVVAVTQIEEMTQKQILLFLKVAEVTACNFFVKHFQLYTQKVSKSFLPTTKKRDVDCGDVSAGMLTKHLTVVSLTAWKVSTLVELKKSPLSVKLSRVLFIALPFRVHVTVGLGYQPAATHWNVTCWSYITFMLGPAMLIVPFSEKDRGEFRSRRKPISDPYNQRVATMCCPQ